jgi:hypothetical protein
MPAKRILVTTIGSSMSTIAFRKSLHKN